MITFEEAMTGAQDMEIIFPDNTGISGQFTNGRVDKHTIPGGWHAYDLREDPETGYFCSIEPNVLINHGGTFMTQSHIPMNSKPNGDLYLELSDKDGMTSYSFY